MDKKKLKNLIKIYKYLIHDCVILKILMMETNRRGLGFDFLGVQSLSRMCIHWASFGILYKNFLMISLQRGMQFINLNSLIIDERSEEN